MSRCPAGKFLFPIVTIWQSYKQESTGAHHGKHWTTTIDNATINTNVFIFRFPIKSLLNMKGFVLLLFSTAFTCDS